MARGDRINFKPHFKDEGGQLPCEGTVGDFHVLSPLDEGEQDNSPNGLASFWLCTRSADGERPATWARLRFDGIASCETPMIPDPPQNLPELNAG